MEESLFIFKKIRLSSLVSLYSESHLLIFKILVSNIWYYKISSRVSFGELEHGLLKQRKRGLGVRDISLVNKVLLGNWFGGLLRRRTPFGKM